ncbi:MAG: sugar phosphate isomerase/epimerase [Chloroflexi bacterium]|nr:sugar phosphate isomerase/epimerase [Chloroflexota bacterium]
MQIGIINNPRNKLLEEIQWIAAHNFDFIDLLIAAPGAAPENRDWTTVRAAITDEGLGVICQAPAYLPIDNPSPIVRQAALDELRRCVDVAQIVGATICTTRFLGWPDYLTENAGYEYYRQLIGILIKHGQEQGVQIALENSPQNSHQLKYFREIFHRLPDLKLLYHIGHGNIQTMQSMTREYLFALADRLVHVHLSDNGGARHEQLPLGAPATGGINLLRELRTLRSFRYDGSITLAIAGDRRWVVGSAELLRTEWLQAL